MRYYTSVWNLLVRRSFWRVLLILVLTACGNILAYLYFAPRHGFRNTFPLDSNALRIVLFLGFTAMMAVVSIPGCSFHTHNEYTLQRLGISERTVFFLQAVFNACCFVLLWMVQLICLFSFDLIANGMAADAAQHVRYYDATLFHSLLPLRDGWRWGRNIMLVAGLGLSTAVAPFHQRRGRFAASLVLMFISANLNFAHDIMDDWIHLFGWRWDLITMCFVAFVIVGILIHVFTEVRE